MIEMNKLIPIGIAVVFVLLMVLMSSQHKILEPCPCCGEFCSSFDCDWDSRYQIDSPNCGNQTETEEPEPINPINLCIEEFKNVSGLEYMNRVFFNDEEGYEGEICKIFWYGYHLEESHLTYVYFPLGNLTKDMIEDAEYWGLCPKGQKEVAYIRYGSATTAMQTYAFTSAILIPIRRRSFTG